MRLTFQSFRLVATLLLTSATLCATANAQCFNIDIGGCPLSTPPASYGALAGQDGTWNEVPIGGAVGLVDVGNVLFPLVGIASVDTPASSSLCATGGSLPGIGGDAALFNDFAAVPANSSTTWTISGLAAGTYNIYLYCWDSVTLTTRTNVTLPSGGAALCGPWNGVGFPPQGLAYVVDLAVPDTAGTLTWTIAPFPVATGTGTINGVQIVKVNTGAVNYCACGSTAIGCCAAVSAAGAPSATATYGFHLRASNVPGGKNGIFYWGTGGQQANAWGNGTSFQCVVPPVQRSHLLFSTGTLGACDGFLALDLNARWTAKPLTRPALGAAVEAQAYFRDPGNTSNQQSSLSDAISFVQGP